MYAAKDCARYRPAARIPQAEDSAAGNIGLRCVASALEKSLSGELAERQRRLHHRRLRRIGRGIGGGLLGEGA